MLQIRFLGWLLAAVGLGGIAGCAAGWWTGNGLMFNLGAVSLVCSAPMFVYWCSGLAPTAAQQSLAAVTGRRAPERRLRGPAEAPVDQAEALVEEMLANGRYALLLRPQLIDNLTADQRERALEALDANMALVPVGSVALTGPPGSPLDDDGQPKSQVVHVEPYYLDRFPVTNAEFKQFVDAGGYEQISLWDPEIWPGVVELVDRTGHPGPRFWNDGNFPQGEAECPAIAVSWHEAAAYARWAGKRLPSDPEWVKAACWPVPAAGTTPRGRRYPWGDAMDRSLANLWGLIGRTVPVRDLADGASVGGIYQMCGNVWEWTASDYAAWAPVELDLDLPGTFKSLRGGAFDTYFDNQASGQFQSGDLPVARKHNIGFRCAIGGWDLAPTTLPARRAVVTPPSDDLSSDDVYAVEELAEEPAEDDRELVAVGATAVAEELTAGEQGPSCDRDLEQERLAVLAEMRGVLAEVDAALANRRRSQEDLEA